MTIIFLYLQASYIYRIYINKYKKTKQNKLQIPEVESARINLFIKPKKKLYDNKITATWTRTERLECLW